MRVDLLIDGYNLLHAAGLAKPRYAPGDLHRRRARLLQKLADLLDPAVLSRATVVFDAHRDPPTEIPPEPSRSLTVLFAPPHQEADDMIEELLAKHSVPKQVLVVSSDHRLQKAARRRGASAIDSDLFLEQLEEDHERTPDRQAPADTPTHREPIRAELDDELAAAAEEELRRLAAEREPAEEPTAPTASPPSPKDEVHDPTFWEQRLRENRDPGGPPRPRR